MKDYIKVIKDAIEKVINTDMEEKTALFMLSALVKIFDKTEYMELFLEFIHSMETINIKTLDMLIPQISMMLVKNPELNSKKSWCYDCTAFKQQTSGNP